MTDPELIISKKTGNLVQKRYSHNTRKKFKTPEKLQEAIEEYFSSCYKRESDAEGDPVMKRPYSVARLALHLNMSRHVFLRYCKGEADYMASEKDENGNSVRDENGKIKKVNISFRDTMQRALTQIEAFNEEALFTHKSTDGPKFALKNNHRWRDQIDFSGDEGGPIQLTTITSQMSDEEAMRIYTDNIKSTHKKS